MTLTTLVNRRYTLQLLVVLLALAMGPTAAWAQKPVTGVVLRDSLRLIGTRSTTQTSTPSATSETGLEFRSSPDQDQTFEKQVRGTIAPARVSAAHVPTPEGQAVVPGESTGFDGLTHRDERLADGGNQFSIEPPDQGLAVGSGFIVEAVNLAIRYRNTNGTVLDTLSLNQFFGLPSAIQRTSPPVFGPFVSDPKAYYDPALHRFFVTALEIDVDPATGAFLDHSSVLIAVSQTADPTGAWHFYSLDTTNDGTHGTPSHDGCPCFGDQPLIGADANGFYITTNEFPLETDGFNGAQVYAMSKASLAAGAPTPVVFMSAGDLEEGPSYSLQPATTPSGGLYETGNGGTEYFMSALEFTGTLDNRLAVWALTGTASLSGATPSLALQYAVVASEVYGQPPAMQQKDGPLPLADLIKARAFGKQQTEHLPLIESNDDRMNQTVYAAGQLWCALNTVVQPKNGPVRTGIAWFIVSPSWNGSTLSGSVANQGYVSVNGQNVAFPSVAVNAAGTGLIGFSLVGPDYYPSAAYVDLDASGTSDVKIAAAGAAPEDGFTGYATFGGRAARWGDYSAAVADEEGNIWFATEYIPALPRTSLANWGTYISKVTP